MVEPKEFDITVAEYIDSEGFPYLEADYGDNEPDPSNIANMRWSVKIRLNQSGEPVLWRCWGKGNARWLAERKKNNG